MMGELSAMTEEAAQSVALPAIVDLDALDGVRDQLIDSIDRGPVDLDASGVERVATNALVMFLSAAETAKRLGFSFTVSGISEPMSSAIERLGMISAFEPLLKGQTE